MNQEQPKSWWQTVPGILTGLAAVITATAGLIVALQQVGILDKTDVKNSVPSNSISPKLDLLPDEVKAVINDPDGYTNVRFGQGTKYDIITRVTEGEIFYTIPQKTTDWWPVRTTDGKHGYMHSSRIKIQN